MLLIPECLIAIEQSAARWTTCPRVARVKAKSSCTISAMPAWAHRRDIVSSFCLRVTCAREGVATPYELPRKYASSGAGAPLPDKV